MKPPHNTLVLGTFSRLPVRSLEPFSRSLRATSFGGEFHVLCAGYGDTELAQLDELGDRVVAVDKHYTDDGHLRKALGFTRRQRGMRRLYPALFAAVCRAASERSSLDRWRSLEFGLEGLQSLRYLHYHQHLLEEARNADVVMLTDLRDVVFQGDPFADPVGELEFFLEDQSEQVGHDSGFNTRWLRDLYGAEFVRDHLRMRISCSGVVIGRREQILAYLSQMIANIVWRRRPMGSHDQGVHNALIYTGAFPEAQLVSNEFGRVLTLGRMAELPLDTAGYLVNADGSVPPVIHQWDRHPESLADLAVGKYVAAAPA